MDLGKILQDYFDMYRSRGLTTQEFFDAVKKAYIESGQSETAANQLANSYMDYATTGKSLNGPEVAPFHNPVQPGEKTTGTGTTGAGQGPGSQGSALLSAQKDYLEEDPVAAWSRQFNLPAVGGNQFQNWMASQQAPTYSAYAGQNILNRMGGGTAQTFDQYLTPEGRQQAGSTALNALSTARGLTQPKQTAWRQELEGEDVGGSLKSLLQAAIQGKGYASPFARSAVRNVPGYERQWQTETLGGSTPGTSGLLEYLMKQMGL